MQSYISNLTQTLQARGFAPIAMVVVVKVLQICNNRSPHGTPRLRRSGGGLVAMAGIFAIYISRERVG
jgi:hypothetical protein